MHTAGPSPNDVTAMHLAGELGLLELRLKREICLMRAKQGGASDEFAGLYIPDEEIDGYLDESGEDACDATTSEAVVAIEAEIEARQESLVQELRAAERQGRASRLAQLRRSFSLAEAELHVIVACLAADLDLRYQRYFAYLQNDVSKQRPCVQLLGRLFMQDANNYAGLWRTFAGSQSLVGARLLEVAKTEPDESFAARQLKVAEAVVDFLLGGEQQDWRGLGRWREGRVLPEAPDYYCQHHGALAMIVERAQRSERPPIVLISGPSGCAKEDLVLALVSTRYARVLEWDAQELVGHSGDWRECLEVMARDLRLHDGLLWVRHADALVGVDASGRAKLEGLARFLRSHAIDVVLTCQRGGGELRAVLGATELPILELGVEVPDLGERAELWSTLVEPLLPEGAAPSRALFDSLAAKFCFGPGRIAAALRGLEEHAAPDWGAALHQACRLESTSGLKGFARKLPVKYRWDDLVLPGEQMEQLREISNCVRHRRRVYGEWGFEDKFSLGKGLNLLFSGPSGTGKTMSAEVLANELGLDVYQIDLSSVVSKYIGETEKNLSRIFGEAQSANCILLFDEADALFGRRSEVKDSHDRYANIEINYLLQRMEEYEGIVILTTNMLKNLDPAFVRRIHFTLEFPLPDERQREVLWAKVFPASMPRAAGLDIEFLARRFKLTGANIKNIALNGAFLAASNGGVVEMNHLILAMKREYRKLGKLASKSEFGPYYSLVRDADSGSTAGA